MPIPLTMFARTMFLGLTKPNLKWGPKGCSGKSRSGKSRSGKSRSGKSRSGKSHSGKRCSGNRHGTVTWYIFIPKIPYGYILEGFGIQMLVYFMAMWNILLQLGICMYVWPFGIF
jgi:hypothetical protein